MPALEKLKNFLQRAELVSKASMYTRLTELYRAPGETFLMDNAVYVDVGKVATRTGGQGLWTDGAAGGCSAFAAFNSGKVVLAHVVCDCETKAEGNMLATMAKPTLIAIAMAPGSYTQALSKERYAQESSLYGAINALEQAFPTVNLNELAGITTVMTGFGGRDWSHECVLAAHTGSGIGFFMGANDLETTLSPSQQWRIRRNSYNGGAVKPVTSSKKPKTLSFLKKKDT